MDECVLSYIFTLLPEGKDMMYIISSIHSEHLAEGRCWAHVAPKPPSTHFYTLA